MQHQHSSLISKTTSRLIEKLNFCFSGNATEVLFHVTVMSLDTIDESSMVRISNQSQSSQEIRKKKTQESNFLCTYKLNKEKKGLKTFMIRWEILFYFETHFSALPREYAMK